MFIETTRNNGFPYYRTRGGKAAKVRAKADGLFFGEIELDRFSHHDVTWNERGNNVGDGAEYDLVEKLWNVNKGVKVNFIIGEGGQEPTRGSEQAAGWDLYAAERVKLIHASPRLVPLAFRAEVPRDHMLLIFGRSGLSLRGVSLVNGVGIVDSDYRGEFKCVMVFNSLFGDPTDDDFVIEKGDRIAQAVLIPFKEQNWVEVDRLSDTPRGSGGFGSTGL